MVTLITPCNEFRFATDGRSANSAFVGTPQDPAAVSGYENIIRIGPTRVL